jgi:hypothetical protein
LPVIVPAVHFVQVEFRNEKFTLLPCLFALANIEFQERNHVRGKAMYQDSTRKKLSRSSAAVVSILALFLSGATPALAEETVNRNVDIEVYSSYVDPCTFEPVPVIWEPDLTVSYDNMDGSYDTEMGEQFAEASLFMSWTEGSDSCGELVYAAGTVTADLTMSEDSIGAGLEYMMLCRDFVGESAGETAAGCDVSNLYEVVAKITIPATTAPGIYSSVMSVTWVP